MLSFAFSLPMFFAEYKWKKVENQNRYALSSFEFSWKEAETSLSRMLRSSTDVYPPLLKREIKKIVSSTPFDLSEDEYLILSNYFSLFSFFAGVSSSDLLFLAEEVEQKLKSKDWTKLLLEYERFSLLSSDGKTSKVLFLLSVINESIYSIPHEFTLSISLVETRGRNLFVILRNNTIDSGYFHINPQCSGIFTPKFRTESIKERLSQFFPSKVKVYPFFKDFLPAISLQFHLFSFLVIYLEEDIVKEKNEEKLVKTYFAGANVKTKKAERYYKKYLKFKSMLLAGK